MVCVFLTDVKLDISIVSCQSAQMKLTAAHRICLPRWGKRPDNGEPKDAKTTQL